MSDWKECRIGDICQTNLVQYKENQGWSDFLYLDTSNITENQIAELQGFNNFKDLPSRARRIVENDDIIYSTVRPNLKHYGIIKNKPDNLLVSTGFCVITANKTKVHPDFLYYILSQKEKVDYLHGIAEQAVSTYPSIKASDIEGLILTLPPLSEQKKIAGILSALDEKIETNRKINARLEELAQAIFKSWLTTCKDRVKIGELCSNILDYTPNLRPKVRLINSADITEGRFDDYPLVENKNLKGHFKKRFRREDILYSEIRPRNHHYGYALIDGDEYVVSTRFMIIRNLPDKVTSAILYQYLLLPEVEADFTAKTESRSGTFPQGTYKDLETIEVPYSSNQNYIDAILRLVRHKIFSLQKESARMSELRDTLLPKLMSGEIKVEGPQSSQSTQNNSTI